MQKNHIAFYHKVINANKEHLNWFLDAYYYEQKEIRKWEELYTNYKYKYYI